MVAFLPPLVNMSLHKYKDLFQLFSNWYVNGCSAIKKDKEEEKKHKTANKNTQGAPGRRSVMTMLLLESNKL